ncbi:MAG: 40S ribosomal protein S13 [Amphiamblys sp. WSBS2006]|nr:MAG: 40S ribosomal protein S13 [Amphiamblys sp. WSBS2006]
MVRLHTNRKGKSGSVKPYSKRVPEWFQTPKEEIIEVIIRLARKGETTSKIGMHLRDTYGLGCVHSLTGKYITEILEDAGIKAALPEDLHRLISKAVALRKHLSANTRDTTSKYQLRLVESKIYRISRYYKRKEKLPPKWRYDPEQAARLVS